MNEKYHIWVSVCIVLTSTRDKNFQQLHTFEVNHYIETITMVINKSSLSRVNLMYQSINLAFEAILFSCLQLDIMYIVCDLVTLQIWISCHQ